MTIPTLMMGIKSVPFLNRHIIDAQNLVTYICVPS